MRSSSAMPLTPGSGAKRSSIACAPSRRSPRACPTSSSSGLFDLDYHTRHVDTIFRRVFGGLDPECGSGPGGLIGALQLVPGAVAASDADRNERGGEAAASGDRSSAATRADRKRRSPYLVRPERRAWCITARATAPRSALTPATGRATTALPPYRIERFGPGPIVAGQASAYEVLFVDDRICAETMRPPGCCRFWIRRSARSP